VATGWIQYEFQDPTKIVEYAVRAATVYDVTANPKDWALQHSDNGADWTPIHTVAGQTGWASGQTRTFTLPGANGSKRKPYPWQKGSRLGNAYKRP
jgi:hypothetical protein